MTKIMKTFRITRPVKLYRWCPEFKLMKGRNMLKNRNLIVGLASVGLFANLFVAFAGDNLADNTASLFGNIGIVALALGFILSVIGQKCEAEARSERDEIYRDFDAVYRYVDDTARDIRDDIRDCSKSDKCCVKK